MRIVVAGGRDYRLKPKDYSRLNLTLPVITELVSGGCPTGVDADAEAWAVEHKLLVKRFPADWDKHGRAAGPIRNAEMAAYAHAVILFPGGRGTESMYQQAIKANKPVYDWRNKT